MNPCFNPMICLLLAACCLSAGFCICAEANDDAVSFNQDIAPIIYDRCTSCHRPGQVGPFPLISYQDVSKRARTIDAVIDSNYMPPWKPTHHGIEFNNDRRLTNSQKAKFKRWISIGKPEGTGPAPAVPVFPSGWRLGKPDLVTRMNGKFKVPASGPDVYRSFVFPIKLPEDKWVKAIEYRPTATSAVHHAIFFVDENGNGRRLDGSDGIPGIAGMGFLGGSQPESGPSSSGGLSGLFTQMQKIRSGEISPEVSRAFNRGLGGYVPGWTPSKLPGDLAMILPRESDIIMQTHFHPSGKIEYEQGEIAIYFADQVPSKRMVPIQIPAMFGVGLGIRIPAGESNFTITESFQVPIDIQLVSIGGHAHYICRTMKMTAQLPSGKSMVLLEIDNWDLDWQDRYYFKNLLQLPAGTKITSELVYDNSAGNPENPNNPPKEIRWGRQSSDEMGSINVQVVAVDESERPQLERALGRYFIRSILRGDVVDLLMQLDTNRDGGLQTSEAPARMAGRFKLLDLNHDGRLDRNELAVLRRFFPKPSREDR